MSIKNKEFIVMASIISTIKKIRKKDNFELFERNDNRYCVSVKEMDSVESYMFSVPIRDFFTNAIVEEKWTQNNGNWQRNTAAENSMVTVCDDSIFFFETRLNVELKIPFKSIWKYDCENLVSEKTRILSTTNGVVIVMKCSGVNNTVITVKTSDIKNGVQKNTQFFALMESQFKPEITLSSLFYRDSFDNITPIQIKSDCISDCDYSITFLTEGKAEGELFFEVNFHEERLFQDTTVSEERSLENNAFGSIAFLGHTKEYGEQRIYIKLMLDQLYEYAHRKITSLKLYIPTITTEKKRIEAHQMGVRFCSFGSTWETKKPFLSNITPVSYENGFLSFDLTSYMAPNGRISYNYGLMIKIADSEFGNIVIPTGDCCAYPIILKIVYER